MEKNSSTSSSDGVRRFLLRMLLPVVAAVAILCVLLDPVFYQKIVLKNLMSGAHKIYKAYETNLPNEIPIFGSSRAAGSYIPDEIHPDCWNYGIEKTQYEMLEILLSQELKKDKTTPIIINWDYEMYEEWFCNPAYLIPHVDKPEIRAFMGDEYHWSYRIPLIRFYGHYDGYLKNQLAMHSSKNLINKGGFFLKDPFNPKKFARQIEKRKESQQKFAFRIDWDKRFRKLLRDHPERKFILVVAPYHSSYFHNFPGYKRAQDYLTTLEIMENVEVLDFGQAEYPDEMFKNTSHLNLAGARRFSRELKEKLSW